MSATAPLHLVRSSIRPSRALGMAALALASGIWGVNFAVSKAILPLIPPMPLLALRIAIAFLFLLVCAIPQQAWRVARKDLPTLALLGMIGFPLSTGALFIGADLLSASMASLLFASSPAFIGLCAWIFLREPMHGKQWGALSLAIAGMALMTVLGGSIGQIHPGGICLVLLSSLAWAVYTVLGKRVTQQYSALTIQLYSLGFGLLGTLPFALRPFPLPTMTPALLGGILYLGLVATALAFWLWNQGFAVLPSNTGSLFFFVQPLTGLLASWAWFGETLEGGQILGALVLLGGVLLSMLPNKLEASPSLR